MLQTEGSVDISALNAQLEKCADFVEVSANLSTAQAEQGAMSALQESIKDECDSRFGVSLLSSFQELWSKQWLKKDEETTKVSVDMDGDASTLILKLKIRGLLMKACLP